MEMKWHPIENGDLSGIQQQETLLFTIFDERQNENYVTTGWILENEGELQVRGVDPWGLNSNETKKVKAWMELPEPFNQKRHIKCVLTDEERGEMSKPILDACCGSRMFWFDKENPNVVFCDNREVPYHEYYPGRHIEIKPDILCDFTQLPFEDNAFKLVVFDPPHLIQAGQSSWMALKYGRLEKNWPQMIHDGFQECMRVLDDYGVLIFKWSEVQIQLKEVLKAIGHDPLFGHRSGKHNNTHWLCFMKLPQSKEVTK